MSARLDIAPGYRRMSSHDLDVVMEIERVIYPHPWTRGNFSDSLAAGYHCWIVEYGGVVVGYSVAMIAAGEAHLLNLSIAAPWQRRGLGSELLKFILGLARDSAATKVYLEVRPSNTAAIALYTRAGFSQIGSRRNYYPSQEGSEDAVVMERVLVAQHAG
jgi:ribosomal-protein-alanine N-acetyltransferase